MTSLSSPLGNPSPSPSPRLLNRVVRTYLGSLSLALDGARTIALEPQLLVQRGAKTESNLEARVDALWHTLLSAPSEALATMRGFVRKPLVRVQTRLHASTEVAEEELERQVEVALARLGIPTRERIQRLAREIDALTLRIDVELERLADEAESFYTL